jgi:type IV secretory pathway TrbD component
MNENGDRVAAVVLVVLTISITALGLIMWAVTGR